MPPVDDQTTQAHDAAPATPTDAVTAAMATLAASTPPADAVRQSPEYQALLEQNRTLARQAGTSRAEAERLRAQQEADRQAAEAQRAATIAQQLQATLGPGAQRFAEMAQLLQTDPVAAAQRFAEWTRVQSPATTQPQGEPVPQPQEAAVPQQQPVPPMAGGLGISASAPLGAPPQRSSEEQVRQYLNAFEATVAANRDMQQRTRVRGRERAAAIGSYLKGALLRDHGVDPDLTFEDR